MSLILGLGSNLGNKRQNIQDALQELEINFELIKCSQLFKSQAVDYVDQPFFVNAVAEFQIPEIKPIEIINTCLNIENLLGRMRDFSKGPRIIDIDVLFLALETINLTSLKVPHPRLFSRSFVILPLMQLPYFKILEKHFAFPKQFDTPAELYL